jgi:hypothetical protein
MHDYAACKWPGGFSVSTQSKQMLLLLLPLLLLL